MQNSVYINAIKQISVQQPLTDSWFDMPVRYSENYVRAIDPDFKQYLAPNTARRLGKILKRALIVSQAAMSESGISNPDAIITATGLGCIENTELFLDKMVREGETLLNPTQFMQSTHNTISSLIAIETKCRAYNITYSHKGISFEAALQDAFLQMQSNKIKNVLAGAHDEMTPSYFTLLKKAGFIGQENQVFAGETAVAMILSTEQTENTLCKIDFLEMKYKTNNISNFISDNIKSQTDFIMTGINGNAEHDKTYFENCARLFPDIPLLQYKNIFGESYTAPAFGIYAAALCLKNGKIPEFLMCSNPQNNFQPQSPNSISGILCYNCFENKHHTFVLLSKAMR
jgi:3-oxoacyl-(acyl-carrier-protein) synthase